MRITGSEAIVDSLRFQGVDTVFGLLGSGLLDIVDTMLDAHIRFVGVRHEQTASHMADGYARAGRRLGVCMAGEGGGAANLLTGVAAAFRAHSPILALTSTTETSHLHMDFHQEIDQVALFEPVTKLSLQVNRADRIPDLFRKAFRVATSGRMGPVHIDLPRDLQFEVLEKNPEPFDSYEAVSKPGPGSGTVRRAIDMIASSKRPLVVAGGGVVWSDAFDELVEFAEIIDIPVATSRGHCDAFPTTHALSLGCLGVYGSRAASKAASSADLVVALGTRLGELTLPLGTLKDPKVIQVDIEPEVLGKSIPVSLGIACDAREFLRAVLATLKGSDVGKKNSKWLAECSAFKRDWKIELESHDEKRKGVVNPYLLYKELNRLLPEGSVVAVDSGILSQGFAYAMLDYTKPRTLIAPVGFSNVGFSYGEALGAKMASGDHPVVSIAGDGGFSMMMNEVLTAVQEGIDVIAVVLNNSAWGTEKLYQDYVYGREIGSVLKNPDFAKVAAQMGAFGVRIESLEEFREAFPKALNAGKPCVLDVIMDGEIKVAAARFGEMKKPERTLFRGNLHQRS